MGEKRINIEVARKSLERESRRRIVVNAVSSDIHLNSRIRSIGRRQPSKSRSELSNYQDGAHRHWQITAIRAYPHVDFQTHTKIGSESLSP